MHGLRFAAALAALLFLGCSSRLDHGDGAADPAPREVAVSAPAPASVATPVIRSFVVEPSVVDVATSTSLTFRWELEPWSGPPVVCRITPRVGAATSPATRRLSLDQSTVFTLACRAIAGPSVTATASATVLALPAVVGAEPSTRAVAFYYPWYGAPAVDGRWEHWDYPGVVPPLDITSPYYPVLGAYSANDPEVIAQHFAWFRRAGVGVAVLSFWGQDNFTDRAVAGLLDMAARYRVKVAFHIEPYGGRSADQLVQDVAYLYERYGQHPGFFRHSGTSRHSPSQNPKGVFFLWAPGVDYIGGSQVDAAHWRPALDQIHASAQGGLVIAHSVQPSWIDGGHFDGLYNYATVDLDPSRSFDWAMGIPPGAWYVPSVLPGFRHWSDPAPFVPRRDGATYADQWQAALGTGVEPMLVSITSFNEWHEGTQIEPAAAGVVNSGGTAYLDYSPLDPGAYLDITRDEVAGFLSAEWPVTYAARIRVQTSADWTGLRIDSGAAWMRPELIDVSQAATSATMENGRFQLLQPLANAQAGESVEMIHDLFFHSVAVGPDARVRFAIERGHIGQTTVTISNAIAGTPTPVATFTWDGVASDPMNTGFFELPAELLVLPQ